MNKSIITLIRTRNFQQAHDSLFETLSAKLAARLEEEMQTVMSEASTNRNGWATLKTLTSHVDKSRWLRELKPEDESVGYVKFPSFIPSPYQYARTRKVSKWQGKNVICVETAHKRYEIIAVPSSETIHDTDPDA